MSQADSILTTSFLDLEPLIREVRQVAVVAYAIAEAGGELEVDAVNHVADALSRVAADLYATWDRAHERPEQDRRPAREEILSGLRERGRQFEAEHDPAALRGTLRSGHTLYGVREAFSGMEALLVDGELKEEWKRGMAALARHIAEWEAIEADKHTPSLDAAAERPRANHRIIGWGHQIQAATATLDDPRLDDDARAAALEWREQLARLIAGTPASSPGALLEKLRIGVGMICEWERESTEALNLLSALRDCERLAAGGDANGRVEESR